MCDCASCTYTDSFAKKGFADWPRGEPAGPRRSAADYAAHVRYSQQWGRGYGGVMHERKECTVSTAGTRAAPERLIIPKARWEQVGYHRSGRKWIDAPETMAEYISQFETLNGLKKQEPVKAPARPHAPGKAREHFPELDREPEASKIYTMPKPDKKRPGRPPLVSGGMDRVLVTLDADTIAKARKLGGGKLSPGLREAVRRVKTG